MRQRRLIVVLCAVIGGCHSWHRHPTMLTQPIDERTRVQLWYGGAAQVVHAVRVREDSVEAVPYWLPPDCDSCAVRIPVSLIDSVRVQRDSPSRTALLGTALLVVTLFAFYLADGLSDLQ